ncbi:hypothetical protein QAD02_017491 [Eretmocerus hayati]|uniref:Uncharacterized protein n=1 Tax=Eretmocerus hayati TaxID=131215 RepID=A0ACC2PDN0_9HYME|nr:hypothetical protein QAD02_017491 [Eretmocerus hayati]
MSINQLLASIRASMNQTTEHDNQDGLYTEKELIKSALKSIEYGLCSTLREMVGKNVEDSIALWKSANKILNSAGHCRTAHEQIWKLLSWSIAVAPNNSEELAIAFMQRAELFFHMKMYQECIIDCEKALNHTNSKSMTSKLLDQKSLCSSMISKQSDFDDDEKLVISTSSLELGGSDKKTLIEKMFAITNTTYQKDESYDDSDIEDDHDQEELPNFHTHRHIPSASEAIDLNYSKKWGRHVIADREIQPGEILAIEKSFYTFIHPSGQYTHCSNCAKATWNSFPCKYCIYDVYCSDRCRGEAWMKYHQFECEVYPFLENIVEDSKDLRATMRFTLLSAYKAGGIQRLRDEIVNNHQCTDSISKGFSNNIFDSGTSKAANSLFYDEKILENNLTTTMLNNAAIAIYLLTTKSNFFGDNLDLSKIGISTNEEILFIGALLLKNSLMLHGSGFTYDEYNCGFQEKNSNGMSLFPFCGLFNHSCNPNADYFTTKDNELVIFSRHKIEEGNQIFIPYQRLFYLACSKKKRKQLLKDLYFTCKCQACTERWSHLCAPSINDLLQSTPYLAHGINTLMENSQVLKFYGDVKMTKYTPELLDTIVFILQTLAEKVSVNCKEYTMLVDYVRQMFIKTFGNWFEIPDQC